MCKNSESWVFTLRGDHVWSSGEPVPRDVAFVDRDGIRRLEIRRDGSITVLSGYAWDGCTPKVCVLDIVLGIPDGVVDTTTRHPRTYYASLVHDALYQFLSDGLPYTRAQADRFFLRLMDETSFTWRYPYYWAVRVFGGVFRRLAKAKRHTCGRLVAMDGA